MRSEDAREVPATLRLIGQSAAGASFSGVSGPAKRSASLRSNGAGGADAIVIQENAEQRQGEVLISEAACSGTFIRRKGQDFSGGDVLLRAGRALATRYWPRRVDEPGLASG